LLATGSAVIMGRRALTPGAPGATPTYDSAGATYNVTAIAAAHSVPLPAAWTSTDLILLAALAATTSFNAAVSVPPASPWLAFPGNPYQSATDAELRLFLYYQIMAAAGGGGTVGITLTGGTTAQEFMGKTWRFRAANGFNATPVANIVTVTSTGSQLAGPTLPAAAANRLGVAITTIDNDRNLTNFAGSTPDTWIERTDDLGLGVTALHLQTIDLSSGGGVSGGLSAVSGGVGVGRRLTTAFQLVPANG
jgi:hypothetical protein